MSGPNDSGNSTIFFIIAAMCAMVVGLAIAFKAG